MITERARAKVNLTLKILGRRADGYHQLESLVAFADGAHDIITLDLTQPSGLKVSGPFAPAIVGDNIVQIAIDRLRTAEPDLNLGFVHIEKNLPVAAGIGGGSANAGALLRAIKRANPEIATTIDWLDIAKSLGADVPVCFQNQTTWMTGLGDELTPVFGLPKLPALLVNPLAPVPTDKTAQVFRRLAAPPLSHATKTIAPAHQIEASRLLSFLEEYGNDLEAAASDVVPEIATVLTALRASPGCRYAALSGAGPTCFGIFEDADQAAAVIRSAHPDWWTRPTTLGDL